MSDEVAVWKPNEFKGSDLLPVQVVGLQVDRTGRESVNVGDLILPSLKLLQGSSEEVKQGIPGARAGIFWMTNVKEPIEPPLRVLAVSYHKSRSLIPKDDRPEHAGLDECRSRDAVFGDRYGECARCPHSEWGENRQRPACSESHNYTVLTPFGPAILRFQGRSAKAGREILSAWQFSPKPLFAHPIVIGTKTVTDKVNGRDSTTHVMETRWAQREDVPPAAQQVAREWSERVSAAHEQGRLSTDDMQGPDA